MNEEEFDPFSYEIWRQKPDNVESIRQKAILAKESLIRYAEIDNDLSAQIDEFLSIQDHKRSYIILESPIAQVQLTDFLKPDTTLMKHMTVQEMMRLRQTNPRFNMVPVIKIVTIGVNPHLQRLGIAKALIDYIKTKAQQGGWKYLIIESVINDNLYRYLKEERNDCEEEYDSRNFIFKL